MDENHNIEDFFKKRLESHEFPFQEEDWLLLEKKLGTPNPATSATFNVHSTTKIIVIALAALTAAFVLGWLASELFQGNQINQAIPEKAQQQQSSVMNLDKPPLPDDEDLRSDGYLQKTTGLKEFNEGSNPGSATNRIIATDAISRSDELFEIQENKVEPAPVSIREDRVETRHTVEAYHDVGIKEEGLKLQDALVAELHSPNIPGDISLIKQESPAENTILSVHEPVSPRNRWMIGLVVAPDYNSVGLMHEKTVTAVIGGQLAYSITPRWSVSAGVLYNNKKYSGEGEYYKPPEGYWLRETNGIIPDNIEGSCRVIDIPIMATYQFMHKELISFTASAGIGSYFLLDEKYNFEFSQSNPGAVTHWQTRENTSAAFSIANFALGIEVQTTQKTILAVEPYLKLSAKEIGWGKVKLYSLGLFFTMKYRL
jgi:hypothetical protein